MSASRRRVVIMGIDADRCWYNDTYTKALLYFIDKMGAEWEKCAALPSAYLLSPDNMTALTSLKNTLLTLILEYKPGDELCFDKSLDEIGSKIIPARSSQEQARAILERHITNHIDHIKYLDTHLKDQTTFTFQFLIAAIANSHMIQHIREIKDSFDELQIVCTSSRLDPQIERRAIDSCPCGSIFQDLSELSTLFQIILPEKNILLNKYTVVDDLCRLKKGELFDRCITSYWNPRYLPPLSAPCQDKTKFLYFYGAIHSSMASDPSAQYRAIFFDDLQIIEEALNTALTKHSDQFLRLFPCDLIFHRYTSSILSTVTIHGTGHHNADYAASVSRAYRRCGYPEKFEIFWSDHFIAQPDQMLDIITGANQTLVTAHHTGFLSFKHPATKPVVRDDAGLDKQSRLR